MNIAEMRRQLAPHMRNIEKGRHPNWGFYEVSVEFRGCLACGQLVRVPTTKNADGVPLCKTCRLEYCPACGKPLQGRRKYCSTACHFERKRYYARRLKWRASLVLSVERIGELQAESIEQVKEKDEITSRDACTAISCRPASTFLREIFTLYPEIPVEPALEVLHLLESYLFERNTYLKASGKVGAILYVFAKIYRKKPLSQQQVANLCGTTEPYMRKIGRLIRQIATNPKEESR